MTPLHFACECNNVEIVKIISNKTPELLNELNNIELTPFQIACYEGNIDTVKYLVNNFDIRIFIQIIKNSSKFNDSTLFNEDYVYITCNSPIELACKNGNFECFKFLYDLYITYNLDIPKYLINIASINGNINITRFLLKISPNYINLKTANNHSPFFNAVRCCNIDLVNYFLCYYPINVNQMAIKKSSETTSLILAVELNYIEMVILFINHPKIKINKTDTKRRTPLIRACKKNNIEIVSLLMSHPKINVNIKGLKNSNTMNQIHPYM